jgi:hypothetical protein
MTFIAITARLSSVLFAKKTRTSPSIVTSCKSGKNLSYSVPKTPQSKSILKKSPVQSAESTSSRKRAACTRYVTTAHLNFVGFVLETTKITLTKRAQFNVILGMM